MSNLDSEITEPVGNLFEMMGEHPAGFYRVSWYAAVQTPGGAGSSLEGRIGFQDGIAFRTPLAFDIPTDTQSFTSGSHVFYSNGSQPVRIQLTRVTNAPAPQLRWVYRVESL